MTFKTISLAFFIIMFMNAGWSNNITNPGQVSDHITSARIDQSGPMAPWGKSVGDIDGDGLIDVVVGGHQPSKPSFFNRIFNKLVPTPDEDRRYELVWYRNPTWQRNTISTEYPIRTDLEVGDFDMDGDSDVVALTDMGVLWFRNPDWSVSIIDSRKFHDIELADLDLDGDLDIVLRNQSLFGYNDGNKVTVLLQDEKGDWDELEMSTDHGEGLEIADINNDRYPDIIVNNFWLKNPGKSLHQDEWLKMHYAENWKWNDTYISAADINQDGWPDIVVSPAEPTGQYYRISWFESGNNGLSWKEHVIENNVETVHHSVGAGDFNGDGFIDIFSAEMNQGENENEVKVYLNSGDNRTWKKIVLSHRGSHGMRGVDIDGDFDIEIVGTNWQIEKYWGDYPVELWDWAKPGKSWSLHVIDDDSPWRHLFVATKDLDGDGLDDIVSGRNWYRNPGVLGMRWHKFPIGESANNAVLVKDFDHDGKPDILASKWDQMLEQPGIFRRLAHKIKGVAYPGSSPGREFVWAKNIGQGEFVVFDNIQPADGDYLQGVASFTYPDSETQLIPLSWHKPGTGIQALEVPENPRNEIWKLKIISAFSQDEALSIADINSDGKPDLVTGTYWLNQANGWQKNLIWETNEKPDRNIVVDINGDGRLDVVVGYEAVSKIGKLAWYSATNTVSSIWEEHLIGYVMGPMSLAAADMDADGDIDILVGEHNLKNPETARLILYEKLGIPSNQWRPHLIYRGLEHHDGMVVHDLDGDGDKDIVSIGWGHGKIMVFENNQF